MSQLRATPGPWEAERSVMGCRSICAGEVLVASVEDAPTEANARLIAAAPELYEALDQLHREVLFFLKRDGKEVGKTGPGRSLYDKVEAALAKARGEQ